jgi:hypothetical protein
VKEHTAAEQPTHLARRATGYLRWYPRLWRERYGEEFVAHLEAELEERPVSLRRDLDIALHGVTARFRLQRELRLVTGFIVIVAMALAVVAGFLAYENRSPAVPLAVATGSAAGIPTTPNTINSFQFLFTNHSTTRIRLLHVSLIGLHGYPVPRITQVKINAHHQGNSDETINLSVTTPGLTQAFDHRVVLNRDDSLVIGMAATVENRIYAVDGLKLTYSRNGVTHSKTLALLQTPDLLCVQRSVPSIGESKFCNQGFTKIWALGDFYHLRYPHDSPAQEEAIIATNAAFSYVSGLDAHSTPAVSDVRAWATTLFAHRGQWKIVQVVASTSHHLVGNLHKELLFRFVLEKRSTGAVTSVCIRNASVTSMSKYQSVIPPAIAACPK